MWDRFRGAVPQKLGRSHQQRRDSRQQQQQQQSQQYGDVFTGGGVVGVNGGYSCSVQGGPAARRPPREFTDQRAQCYPHEQSAFPPDQPLRNPNRDSAQLDPPTDARFRPASSIYSSQPSPIQTNFAPAAPNRVYTFQESIDVSPPSSPEPFTPNANGTYHPVPDISPIDEDEEPYDEMLRQQGAAGQRQASRGNIASLRRERRQKQDAATGAALRESRSREQMNTLQPPQPRSVSASRRGYAGGEVRWDPSTGELTSSEKGRPSQVKPAEYAKGLGHSPESDRVGRGTSASPEGSSPFGQRLRRIAPPGFVTKGAERKVSAGGEMSPSARRLSPSPSPSPSPRHASSPMSATAYDPAAGAFTTERPPWKGASGRTALVAPVHDNPETAPLNIPRKRGPKSPATGSAVGALASPPASPLGAETQPQSLESTARQAAPSSQHLANSAIAGYPSPPFSGPEAGFQSGPETTNLQTAALGTQSPSVISPTSAIRRKPAPTTTQSHQAQDSVTSTSSEGDPYNYKNYTAANPPSAPMSNDTTGADSLGVPDGWIQPPSRFSVSTYATSANAAPRPSADGYYDYNDDDDDDEGYHGDSHATLTGWNHRSGTDPTAITAGTTKQESVMDRRRPKLRESGGSSLAGDQDPVVISLKDAQWSTGAHRKPLGPGAGNGSASRASSGSEGDKTPTGPPNLLHHQHHHRPESIMSTAGSIYKPLPPAPPEASAVDRVDTINARLLALANRRINISRSVKQMTELMPTDNIMASAEVLHKREVERRKVDALRAELAEVQCEEYELGIKLHRAYKRIDREAHYEPTTLWVRRVTG
ncbi:hypothetical protein GGTG_05964 [Gaeumannomyces tritici R3-111a-1]|uniref:Uncharacterized protein n=1 Tax=Gaeumannomyces tritici (strain R3-111a-1) TaxID=644352 RepID=J3NXF8_GAET3|nr:hypothetical protein GGTG_05964 [Gaeumannomyces tritici R3-111a-1]EJT76040.1 hypothetical protein GGTG_05964 [Gaeumannomyces tritici R3-111a-1]